MRVAALFGPVLLLLLSSGAAASPILVNGYKPVEPVVTRERYDLRGGSLSIAEGGLAGRSTASSTFSQDALWSDLRNGTILAEADDLLPDTSRNPFNGLGEAWWVVLQASSTGKRQFIPASTASVSNDITRITILDALSQVWFGRPGEGSQTVPASDDRAIWNVEPGPSVSIEPSSKLENGDASSGSRYWLRSVVEPVPLAATLLGVVVAAATLVFRQRAKRAASQTGR